MTVYEALRFIQSQLQPAIGDYAVPQSEEILETLLKCSRTELYLKSKDHLDQLFTDQVDVIINRRLQGEPLQYILGQVYFYSREFAVTPDVLIPRPDTEILVEKVLLHEKNRDGNFADIGTGSGIIACILTEENPGWNALAIDVSYRSLLVARQNIRSQVHLLCADLLNSIKPNHLFNFIVSNPPYISATEMNALDHDVVDFEPHRALFGGNDGLDFYRYLSLQASNWIIKGGAIYCEIGYNQENEVKELFSNNGWRGIAIFKDLGGNPRVIRAVVPEANFYV
jgi:release factor glutamine methyltransferase